MSDREKACALLADADRLGLHVEYDSGFLVVRRSEPSGPRSDDVVAAERAIVEALGECGSDAFELAAGKARAARGGAFVGRRAFVPKEQIVGDIVACDSAGKVTVSYRHEHAPQARNASESVYDGDRMFIIADGDERPDPASSIASRWLDDERFRELLLHVEAAGLRLALDSGFILAKWPATEGVAADAVEAAIRQLGPKITEVAAHLFALARGSRGAAFVGHRVYAPSLGFGILKVCGADGSIDVTYRHRDLDSSMTSHCSGKSVLILEGGCEEPARAASDDEKSDWTWRSLLQKALGGRRPAARG